MIDGECAIPGAIVDPWRIIVTAAAAISVARSTFRLHMGTPPVGVGPLHPTYPLAGSSTASRSRGTRSAFADMARRTLPLAGYFDDPEAEPDEEAPEELPLAPLEEPEPPEDAEALQSAPLASLPLMQVPAFAGLRLADERGEGVAGVAGAAGEADVVLARLPEGVVLFADVVVSAVDGLIEEDVVLPE